MNVDHSREMESYPSKHTRNLPLLVILGSILTDCLWLQASSKGDLTCRKQRLW